MKRNKRSQRGFTLVELMVSLVLFSFAVAGVLAVAVSLAQGYREQRQIVDTESAARGALDFIADSLRMTSPGVTSGTMTSLAGTLLTVDADAATNRYIEDTMSPSCARGSVVVTDNGPFNGSDILQVVVASGPVVTTLKAPWVPGGTALVVSSTVGLAAGDTLLITNGGEGRLVRVQSVTDGTNLVLDAATCGALSGLVTAFLGVDELVVRAMRARFYLQDNTATDGVATALMMDPDSDGSLPAEPLADYIEDFQVSVAIDESDEGELVPAEWVFSTAAGSFTAGRDLKAIRISLVARAAKLLVATSPSYQKPVLENHTPSTAFDAFRRRTLHTSVEIRNFGASP